MPGKYDNSPECAWNSLRDSACIHLEQYEKGQVVFSRAVEIYTPLGEFHPANELRELGSTKIVLVEFQPKSALGDLGSTIINQNIRIMERFSKKSVFLSAIVLSAVCFFLMGVGFVLGDFQAVLYSLILEMFGLFVIGLFLDGQIQQMEDFTEM